MSNLFQNQTSQKFEPRSLSIKLKYYKSEFQHNPEEAPIHTAFVKIKKLISFKPRILKIYPTYTLVFKVHFSLLKHHFSIFFIFRIKIPLPLQKLFFLIAI